MYWIHRPEEILSADYTQVVREKTEDLSPQYKANIGRNTDLSLKTDIEYFSLAHLDTADINITYQTVFRNMERIGLLYQNSSWKQILERLAQFQPAASRHCTLGVISPFSKRLEWLSVSCDEKLNQSVLICKLPEKQLNSRDKNIFAGVLTIDLSYYNLVIEGHISYRKRVLDTVTPGSCVNDRWEQTH